MDVLKIVKIGGNIIDDDAALDNFLAKFSKLTCHKILVHGGGKIATKVADKMGVEVKMNEGRRITDQANLDIITMVYAGKINKTIVAKLQAHKCNAIGLTGADGNSIVSEKRKVTSVDYGFAGDVSEVNTETLELLLKLNIAPVFCAITHDGLGQLLNTNADTVASELAIGFAESYETELYYCFEKNGVLKDIEDDTSIIEIINTVNYKSLIEEGLVSEGMLPKLNNCFQAITHKVHKVCIGKPEMIFNSEEIFTTIQV
ncbi:acetylglutamate kinase [Ulvibacter antarcticus]|uniref:Acetylglutamate kinase n=1 Tax=Ulvibacter antarcticus TaxID=442714 RepID=A0A3L9YCS2_9FLAO|nr:acetylglutamate kinase [Ulvibacter antarcticus]RMA57227.1 N-acetylglutamate kinase [Ulvibacter antarcticus]